MTSVNARSLSPDSILAMPGIPERFYRIAKHKLSELSDRLEQIDEAAAEKELKRETEKSNALNELKESLESPRAFPTGQNSAVTNANSSSVKPDAAAGVTRPRTPEEIARGSAGYNPTSTNPNYAQSPDPLLLHYQLLGVEPGSDFVTVQGAYQRLAARSDAARFPAGSEEEKQAMEVRTRLEASYKTLKEALDPTSRRFDMLEL